MMLRSNCSNKLKNFILFFATFMFVGIVSAQDGSKSNVATDGKVRNIDGVAAVVNTGYITRKDIDDRIAVLKKQGTKLPEGEALRKVILERLILEKIQLQNAELALDRDSLAAAFPPLDQSNQGDCAAKYGLPWFV